MDSLGPTQENCIYSPLCCPFFSRSFFNFDLCIQLRNTTRTAVEMLPFYSINSTKKYVVQLVRVPACHYPRVPIRTVQSRTLDFSNREFSTLQTTSASEADLHDRPSAVVTILVLPICKVLHVVHLSSKHNYCHNSPHL